MDLPFPKKVVLTSTQLEERRWRTFAIINLLLALYAALHKILIPLVSHSWMDPWAIFHLWMAVYFRKKNPTWILYLSWFGLGYCCLRVGFDFWAIAMAYKSWSAISSIMTEGFSAIFLGYVLSKLQTKKIQMGLALTLLGVSTALLQTGAERYKGNPQPMATSVQSTHDQPTITGVCETTVNGGLLTILPCGLGASNIEIRDKLVFKNKSGRFFNLRIEQVATSASSKSLYKKNTPLFDNQEFTLDPKDLDDSTQLTVRSDSWKAIGPVTIFVKKR